ncbi:MAG: alanine--tRNA ligase [Elusimicrobiota bacterium]
MKDKNIREKFKEYFSSYGHRWYDSLPLVPPGDETILFTTAGMVQFKDKFLSNRGDVNRAASIQKCFRTSDIDEVGKTSRHLTFFEMYGNFSFGDYFKEEAIRFAWEFLVGQIGLSKEKLYATVYKDDDEAFDIWKEYVSERKIYRLGEKDNFWKMGDTGPCGPCSEILYDMGEKFGCGKESCQPGCECDRYIEVWNLVFTQYNCTREGELKDLPQKNIDTGMGLERLNQVVNGLQNVFQTELLKPLMEKARSDADFFSEKSARIIADHARAVTFLIADGVAPSNEGRGYVLRKLIRRASREGQKSGWKTPRLWEYTSLAIDIMGSFYPYLNKRANYIASICKSEEENFRATLTRASVRLNKYIEKMASESRKVLSAERAFKLYDTYGLPPQITENILAERGMKMDKKGFKEIMQRTSENSEWSSEDTVSYIEDLKGLPPSEFVGHDKYRSDSRVIKVIEGEGVVVCNKTPMYPRSGGQVADRGIIEGEDGRFNVEDTFKISELIVHKGSFDGKIREGDKVSISVDMPRRKSTQRNHTATHILQAVLRQVISKNIQQNGSHVAPEGFRFDFTFNRELSDNEIEELERRVNKIILENYAVVSKEMSKEEAEKQGALAFFGEKYGRKVRVLMIKKNSSENLSMELCGGTHVGSTGEIGFFKILSENGVAAGVRRIEAVTGEGAFNYVKENEKVLTKVSNELKTSPEKVIPSVNKLKNEIKLFKKKINALENKLVSSDNSEAEEKIKQVSFSFKDFAAAGQGIMRAWVDSKVEKNKGVALAVGSQGSSVKMILKVSEEFSDNLDASEILKSASKAVKGGAGGRKDMAQGGGTEPGALKEAVEIVKQEIEKKLN